MVVVIYFIQDSMYTHSFGSMIAVKLGQLCLSNNLNSRLVWKCASAHDRVRAKTRLQGL